MRIPYIILFFALCLCYSKALKSQTLQDALRYSLLDFASTARSAGVSGAFNALGADLSTAASNPAGIAEFRSSEYLLGLSVPVINTESSFTNRRNTEEDISFKLDHLAAVFHYNPRSFNIKTLNLAIGVSKLANFNQQFYYEAPSNGTIVQRFLERAEGLTPDELDNFEAGPAFDAGAIYNFDGGTEYDSDFLTLNETTLKSQTVKRSGTFHELYFALASNVNDKVSWGLGMGIPFSEFTETKVYSETDESNSIDFFDEIRYSENLKTSGVGINFKFGLIYKINRLSRIGLSFHSPSWMYLTDEFDTSVRYSFTSNNRQESFTGNSPFSEFDYRMTTPMRMIAGYAQMYDLGELKGFVSGEVEYADYGKNKFNLTANSTNPVDQIVQNDLNDQISSQLGSSLALRLGTELAYRKFRVRIGASRAHEPYTDKDSYKSRLSYSLGLGFRGDRYYLDAAYVGSGKKTQYSPYYLLDQSKNQNISNDLSNKSFVLTIGLKVF